jgi:hypothetical protein
MKYENILPAIGPAVFAGMTGREWMRLLNSLWAAKLAPRKNVTVDNDGK